MEIHRLSRRRFLHTVRWGLAASVLVVAIAAGVGRATVNLQGALTDKPNIAIYLLLPEEEIGRVEVLKETDQEMHYMAETKDGPKFVILKKGEEEWFVSHIEQLHADGPVQDEE